MEEEKKKCIEQSLPMSMRSNSNFLCDYFAVVLLYDKKKHTHTHFEKLIVHAEDKNKSKSVFERNHLKKFFLQTVNKFKKKK